MTTKTTLTAVGAAAATMNADPSAARCNITGLLEGLQSGDENARTEAWLNAGEVGAPAILPLAKLMAAGEIEIARAAKRALWQIVRRAGQPEADREQRQVAGQLLQLLKNNPSRSISVEAIHMLGEIGGPQCVQPLAESLKDPELREDARQALQQIPGPQSIGALKAALAFAPDDFKGPLAAALRARGVKTSGYPCQKLKPVRTPAKG